jgi:hypothetical protein
MKPLDIPEDCACALGCMGCYAPDEWHSSWCLCRYNPDARDLGDDYDDDFVIAE